MMTLTANIKTLLINNNLKIISCDVSLLYPQVSLLRSTTFYGNYLLKGVTKEENIEKEETVFKLKLFFISKSSFLYHHHFSKIECAELHASYVFVSHSSHAPLCFHALRALHCLRDLGALTIMPSHWIKLHNECTILYLFDFSQL